MVQHFKTPSPVSYPALPPSGHIVSEENQTKSPQGSLPGSSKPLITPKTFKILISFSTLFTLSFTFLSCEDTSLHEESVPQLRGHSPSIFLEAESRDQSSELLLTSSRFTKSVTFEVKRTNKENTQNYSLVTKHLCFTPIYRQSFENYELLPSLMNF